MIEHKRFTSRLGDCIDIQVRRIKINLASMILIDGGVGQGKTTIAVHIAEHIMNGPIKFSEQLAIGGPDFIKKLQICFKKGYLVIIYDEAGDFNRRNALSQFNKTLNRVFEIFRAFKILVIVILPSFASLDQEIFDKQIPRLLVHCDNRKKNYGCFKAYDLDNMLYLKDKMKFLKIKFKAYNYQTPNFYGNFWDLTTKRKEALDKYTIEGKTDLMEMMEIQSKGLITYDQMSKSLGRSVIWVKKKVSDLKIQSEETIKKVKYFRREVIDILADELKQKA